MSEMSPDGLESLGESATTSADAEVLASLRLSRQEAAEGQAVRLRAALNASGGYGTAFSPDYLRDLRADWPD